jgi:hypothetical protein
MYDAIQMDRKSLIIASIALFLAEIISKIHIKHCRNSDLLDSI